MEIINDTRNLLKAEKHIAWIVTAGVMLAGIPFLKAAIAFVVKLCELLVRHGR